MMTSDRVVVVMDPDMYCLFMKFVAGKVVNDAPRGDVVYKVVADTGVAGVPKKRGPTAYNTFIGKTLQDIAAHHPEMPRNERMKLAQKKYRERVAA
jgi:hypothetical protein